jgi:REP element-mobilizing transposase RayT
VEISPTISLSAFVKDFKLAASHFIRNEKLFPDFNGWQRGYGAFTVSHKSISYVANYIANQEEHHRKKSSRDEFIGFLRENDIRFEDRYVE